jgi:hypothetical protein
MSLGDPFRTSFDFKMFAMFKEGDLHRSGWHYTPICAPLTHLVERYETLDFDQLGKRSVVFRNLCQTFFTFMRIRDSIRPGRQSC